MKTDEEPNERVKIGLKEMVLHCDSKDAAGAVEFISYITFQREYPASK